MSKIYVSTGTMVGRINDYNYKIFTDNAPYIDCDGFEFMVFPTFFDRYEEVTSALERSGRRFPVTHADKDIGKYLSCFETGYREKAMTEFEKNCRAAARLGSQRIVLHLWGDMPSDKYIDNNISCLDCLLEISGKYSLRLLVENVPCVMHDPYSNLLKIERKYPDITFVYDTRFSAFHSQHEVFLNSGWFENGRIEHIHVSDFAGPELNFGSLRPIPHLGKGIAKLSELLPKISRVYNGTYTLESPEMHPDCTYPDLINKDVEFIRKTFKSDKA